MMDTRKLIAENKLRDMYNSFLVELKGNLAKKGGLQKEIIRQLKYYSFISNEKNEEKNKMYKKIKSLMMLSYIMVSSLPAIKEDVDEDIETEVNSLYHRFYYNIRLAQIYIFGLAMLVINVKFYLKKYSL